MIKITNLNKYYNKGKENEIHVINDASLELPSSGLISFLGPSGSGKTTLLNVIGGLDKAKGNITYDDLSIDNYKMHQVDAFRSKEIGYVFQNYNLLLEETVYSNLEIALEMIGIYDKEEQEKRIEYTLKAVGMYKYRKKRAFALSGGQQQRVSIARALVKKAKIIIADEPTGNLDSENTIEVMNILKKISETSLVLVVTHNEEVAKFYSDQVIQIKDGRIDSSYKMGNKQALKTEQANTIYLKDLNVSDEHGEYISLKYYGTNDLKPLELQIIERNGTYFISSNEKIKLLEETNLKIVDGHYQALEQKAIEEFNYDTSWYQEDKKKQNIFKRIWHSFKQSFNKMRFCKRRMKFLYFAFFMIGVVLAICVIGFSNFYIIDDSNLEIDPSFSILHTDQYASMQDIQKEYYSIVDAVDAMTANETIEVFFYKKLNHSEDINYRQYTKMISFKGSENAKFLAGTAPKKGEIVLSKKYADGLIKKLSFYYPSYDSLIGLEFNVGQESFILSGIVDNKYQLCYMEDESFLKYIDRSANYGLVKREYELEKKYDTYTILEGRDLTTEDLGTNNILISPLYREFLGKEYDYTGNTYTVVGVFDFKNYPCDRDLVMIIPQSLEIELATSVGDSYTYKDYELVEGVVPTKSDEVLVSIYSKYDIGATITSYKSNYTYKVVGKYISDSNTTRRGTLFSREMVMLNYGDVWFKVDNPTEVENLLNNKDFSILNIQQYYFHELEADQRVNLLIFGVLALVLIITIAIFIYFIMRSRMISDIYPIGVYRSLGASRFRIIMRFVSDILVTVTLTSLLGYLITTFIFDTLASSINNAVSMNALKSSYLFSFLGVLLLYILNLFFGLFPIMMLMRKTPAEIISKYDI